MAPQLQDLPDELLVDVLGYLPKSDLKSARLTCARYGHIGAQWLFQRVYFAPRKAAIDTFLNISANPTFARTVTELVYDCRQYLVDLTVYNNYKRALDAYCEDYKEKEKARGSTVNDLSNEGYNEFLVTTMVQYVRQYDQQQRMFGDQEDYKALLQGLKNFPNIAAAIALDNFSQAGDWVPLREHDHSWYDQRSGREPFMALAPSSWAAPNKSGHFQKWKVRGIHNLFRAVSKQCQNVKEVHLASETSSAPMTIFEMDDDVYNEACTIAQRLTSLKMDLHLSRWDSEKDWHEQHCYLKAFLSQAKELRCLAISGRIEAWVLVDKVWPHLETLHLGDLGLDAEVLNEILQAHKRTLRELTLRNVNMFGEEGWADAAKEMGKYLRLHRVSVLGVSDEVTREETEDPYLSDETSLAVARSFMQSIPRTTLLDEYAYTIIACPGEAAAGDSNRS